MRYVLFPVSKQLLLKINHLCCSSAVVNEDEQPQRNECRLAGITLITMYSVTGRVGYNLSHIVTPVLEPVRYRWYNEIHTGDLNGNSIFCVTNIGWVAQW